MKHYHPRKDDQGQPVALHQPSQATALATWDDPDQRASVTPQAQMPASVVGLGNASWKSAPTRAAGWERLAQAAAFEEPPLKSLPGKAPASGAVVVEADGRVWVVSPSNRFGGYTHTFPKGKLEAQEDLSLRANALKEVFEESGLQVELISVLCDSVRSTSVTRYYLARRVGGNPADMGWESQAVHLVPMAQLPKFANHSNDAAVVVALQEMITQQNTESSSTYYQIIANHELTLANLPPPNADYERLTAFCLSFDGYQDRDVMECEEIAAKTEQAGLARATMDKLRITAFIRQRAIKWGDQWPPNPRLVDGIRAVVEEIRCRLEAPRTAT